MKINKLVVSLLSMVLLIGLGSCNNRNPSSNDSVSPSTNTTSDNITSNDTISEVTSSKPTSSVTTSKPTSSATTSKPSSTTSSQSTTNNPNPVAGFTITTDLATTKEIHTAAQKAYLAYNGDYATIPADKYPDGKKHISDPNAVNIAWKHTPISGKTLKNYSITFGQKSDLSDGYECKGSTSKNLDLYNVFLGKNYFKINAIYSDNTVESSDISSFTVDGTYPRNIKIDGMTNCRDMGGRVLTDGGMIKQGLIYRTSGTNGWGNNNAVVPDNITAAGKEELLNHLGVKTEINVNSNGNNQVGVKNFVGAYMDYGGSSKHHFSRNIESVKKVFATLANKDNYPLFYHCRIGTDRTGLCAILINGLLGVDKNDIFQDYLFSNFGNIQEKRYIGSQAGQDDISKYIKDIESMPGDTFKNKVYNTLLAVGVTKAQLESVIDILTEGPKVTGNDNGQLTGFNSSLTGVNVTARTSSDRNHPSTYFVLDGAGKGVSYKFTASEDYNATIVSYLGNNNYTASKYIDDAVTVTVDGNAVTVPHNSYQTVGFGNCNNRMNYVPVILGTVNLTKGEHTVKVERKGDTVNLGGISVFNNGKSSLGGGDTPVVPEEPDHKHAFSYGNPVVKEGESTYAVGVCECGKKAYKISAAQDLNGKITAEGKKLPKGTSGNYDGTAIALYKFTIDAPVKGHLMAKVNVDNENNWIESNGYSYYTGKNGGQSPIAVLPDNKTNTVMTVNGTFITMPTTTYYEMGIRGTTLDTCGIADYGEFTLKAGTNEFTLAAVDSYGLQYYEFYFIES
ncbi:MAG: tyrosine-protein phosphatase [Bacillales bacterium]|nr:tyrosine-protein phosphatase [Bacillales bacterium]